MGRFMDVGGRGISTTPRSVFLKGFFENCFVLRSLNTYLGWASAHPNGIEGREGKGGEGDGFLCWMLLNG